ncbi:MAG: hypothetical protein HOE90_20895 [Bacteriovoracaceae bacterium]|jgi:hypothetical protein|nr:hypothetical protein [Bacteriovoracaceae bacterium]
MKIVLLAFGLLTLAVSIKAEEAKPEKLVEKEVRTVASCHGEREFNYFGHLIQGAAESGDNIIYLYKNADSMYDGKNSVVGFVSVTINRKHEEEAFIRYSVRRLYLCGNIEVSSFYYAWDNTENPNQWVEQSTKEAYSIGIDQDEGMINMNATVEKKGDESTLIKVDFRAYNVFEEAEESEEAKKTTGYVEDWGLPRGNGVFFFYLPNHWK